MATYTLATGVDPRATHGTLWVTLGRYSPSFFYNIYCSVLVTVMMTATLRASYHKAIYGAIIWLNYLRKFSSPAFIPPTLEVEDFWRIGYDQLKRLIVPMLRVSQGVLTGDVKLIKGDIV